MSVSLPPDFILRSMAKIASETFTESIALQAEEMADAISDEISGPAALRIFAAAIRSTNKKQFVKGTSQ